MCTSERVYSIRNCEWSMKEKLINSFTATENEINWYRTENQEQHELEWYVVCIRGNWMATVFVLAESVDSKRSRETLQEIYERWKL